MAMTEASKVDYTTTEKNAVVRDWSLKTQKEKGDSLMEGCVSNLPEHVTVNVRQNNLEDLDSDTRGIFTERYGDIANLISINVDEQLIQAMIRFWDLAYQCFIFNQEYMTSTIEEYAALLRIDNVQFYKIYVKEPKPMTFKKKFGFKPPQHVEEGKSVRFGHLRFDRFPKSSWTYRSCSSGFFERLKQGINPVPTILVETFRSLSIWRKGEGRFIRYAQLLNNLRAEDVTGEHRGYALQFCYTRWETKIGFHCLDYREELVLLRYVRRVRDTAKSWKKIHLMELALYADTLTQDYDI
ncbi:hypothetical protein CXB51_025792 [Gossypium anomalum]|uniref:DUF7745 domain-containing protein n=1 Tax=Gossypium anomalum TaxID=47600 RepID=A0A8J6CSR7_9ROSI|nr:hypothetical protein CXB51_025792 [Gossypium anomalum]